MGDITDMLKPSPEVRPIASVLLARCERVLQKLGQDGTDPFKPEELKKLREKIAGGAESRAPARDPFRPVRIGESDINWAETDQLVLADLGVLLKKTEGFDQLVAHLERLTNLGVRGLSRSLLAQASRDVALLMLMEDDALRGRYIATRLTMFKSYPDRKAYGLALGLMEFQAEVIV